MTPGRTARPRRARDSRVHHHVAVGEHDDLVGDRIRHVDQVRDLAVRAVLAGIDHEIDAQRREGRRDASHHADRRIAGALHAEHDLHGAGVVLRAERLQVLEQVRLEAAERFQHRHRRPGFVGGESRRRLRGEPSGEERRGQRVEAARERGNQEDRREPGEIHGSVARSPNAKIDAAASRGAKALCRPFKAPVWRSACLRCAGARISARRRRHPTSAAGRGSRAGPRPR